MDERQKAQADARHAAKMAARRDGTANVQTYPANRGTGGSRIDQIDAAYQAKLEARVAAFNAPREPEAEKSAPTPEAKPKGEKSGKG